MDEAMPMKMKNEEHRIMPTKTHLYLSRWKGLFIQCIPTQKNQTKCTGHYKSTSTNYIRDLSDQDDNISTSLRTNLEVLVEIDHGHNVMDDSFETLAMN